MAKATSTPSPATAETRFTIAKVGLDRPWFWLARGWQDMRAAPAVSIGYGVLFVAAGIGLTALLYALDILYMALPLAAGFILIAPILAVGLYELSRRLAKGETVGMATPLKAWQRNFGQIALLGLVLMLFLLAWIRIASLLFVLFFPQAPLEPGAFVSTVFLSWKSIPFLIIGSGIGAVLATLVFALSVVSVPMLLDRDVSAITAMSTSLDAVRRNRKAMMVWAVLIALFTVAGLTTFYVGLAVTLPLIGHASWHAYRDLVSVVR